MKRILIIISPYIRETIADLTRSAGFPPLHLNPINFVELAKQTVKEKKDS
jgi:preprotein translocase subunit SecB